ncbi:alpha-amylase family glycosyl hydrolase [Actinospica robiniae]|uniref:alpha-amylase family glycosyl hydrolase n=1 Tax=Actinospica robiniae TaxID=304901 RepID=UPI00041CA35C|nr:alpha-amylase family glycosyl hydrolase [Actinospica robiniae]
MRRERLRRDPVLYEVYLRSFADSNGDGIGDLAGLTSRLDHLVDLGVDGLWLTPVFRSPQFDFGYDVSDYLDIHVEYGSMPDMDALIDAAHTRGLAVILDVIIGHTSIEHFWFREHPDRYIWADQIPNNWLSVFGGSAWRHDEEAGRYYYHRFYPEQPNLNWGNPEVRRAVHEILGFWTGRGVDGFRLDSLDGIAVDPGLQDEPLADPSALRGRERDPWAQYWSLQHVHTCNLPQVLTELKEIATAFPDAALVVEADLPNEQLLPYMRLADCSFAFDFIRAPLDGVALARVIDGAGLAGRGNLAWALSNHDQPRMVSRWGRDLAGVAAVLLLSLPGWSFIYQGDEIGMVDGPGGPDLRDRSGRDAVRHPMQWNRSGGFTTGTPWLPFIDPEVCNVEDQRGAAGSTLEQYRTLIRLRRELRGPVRIVAAEPGFLAFRRGGHTISLNLGDEDHELGPGQLVYMTGRVEPGRLGPRSAVVQVADPDSTGGQPSER